MKHKKGKGCSPRTGSTHANSDCMETQHEYYTTRKFVKSSSKQF